MTAALLVQVERICRAAVPLAFASAAFCLAVLAVEKLTGRNKSKA